MAGAQRHAGQDSKGLASHKQSRHGRTVPFGMNGQAGRRVIAAGLT
jgi:hypothetical protein